MASIYYYRIRRYHTGDEPYPAGHGEIVEEGRDHEGGVYFEDCLSIFRDYEDKLSEQSEFTYSIEIIDSRGSD
jgi:hypothetical protein